MTHETVVFGLSTKEAAICSSCRGVCERVGLVWWLVSKFTQSTSVIIDAGQVCWTVSTWGFDIHRDVLMPLG